MSSTARHAALNSRETSEKSTTCQSVKPSACCRSTSHACDNSVSDTSYDRIHHMMYLILRSRSHMLLLLYSTVAFLSDCAIAKCTVHQIVSLLTAAHLVTLPARYHHVTISRTLVVDILWLQYRPM